MCEKTVIGYISGYVSDLDSFNFPVGTLKNIYISPEYRGCGIGNKFITLFKNYCREKNCYNLNVTFYEENISADFFCDPADAADLHYLLCAGSFVRHSHL